MEDKIDFKKERKDLYNPTDKRPVLIDVPEFSFLMIDGEDSRPESPGFQQAINALFGVSYTVKMDLKKNGGTDYGVLPLEGLWWADDINDFTEYNKERWKWTLMIRQPDFISQEKILRAMEILRKKGQHPFLEKIRYEKFREGLCGQIMHIGPFSEEHDNIIKIHKLIEESGGFFDDDKFKHHEIYLSDFRRVNPVRMRTVIRQPFIKKGI